jgi:membrane associated rhomboid family serine protease
VLAIFFQKTTPTPGLEAAGLISAVIGLVLFLEGLRVAVMPMAMLVGEQLPKRLKLPFVLLVAFALGVLVTYAEPAIAAIRQVAAMARSIREVQGTWDDSSSACCLGA